MKGDIMYCIKCGVELSDSEKKCPLCGTAVYNPTLEIKTSDPPYPPDKKVERMSTFGALIITTVLFIIPMLISLICNLKINGKIDWSLYVVGGLLLIYIVGVMPAWFQRPNLVIFWPCDLVAIGAYVLLICELTGGKWFLSFAFPLIGGILLISEAVVTLTHYLRRGYLYIFGGMFIAIGAFMMLVEFLAYITFDIGAMFVWSFYPLIAFSLIGLMLIIIAICKPIRKALEKKFFI